MGPTLVPALVGALRLYANRNINAPALETDGRRIPRGLRILRKRARSCTSWARTTWLSILPSLRWFSFVLNDNGRTKSPGTGRNRQRRGSATLARSVVSISGTARPVRGENGLGRETTLGSRLCSAAVDCRRGRVPSLGRKKLRDRDTWFRM